MSVSALALVLTLLCALAWSGFDLGRKALVAKIDPVPILVLLTVGQTPLFLVWTLVDGWPRLQAGYWAPALASVALNVVANLAFIYAFKLAPISLTIPLLSLTPALTALLAVPMLGELPTWRQGAGIALVVAGAFLLNLRRGDAVTLPAILRAFVRERGALLMLVVAFCWAITPPLDKMAFRRASVPFHAFVLCFGVFLALLAVLALQRRLAALSQVRRAPRTYVAALLVSTVALGLQFLAYGLTLVAFVETVKRGIGNVLALVYGRGLFAEEVGRARVGAVVLMAVGVGLILF